MDELLYLKHNNLVLCIENYRKYKILNKKIESFDEFKKLITKDEYISYTCYNPREKVMVYFYLFKNDTHHLKKTDSFKKIIKSIVFTHNCHDIKEACDKQKVNIICITKVPFSIYIKKAINKISMKKLNIKLNIKNYLHKIFIIEPSTAPMCGVHTLLDPEEAKLIYERDLSTSLSNIAKILQNDPQIIWIGGEIDDIVKIEKISLLSGLCIEYRCIIQPSNKFLNADIDKKENLIDDVDADDVDDVDDDIELNDDVIDVIDDDVIINDDIDEDIIDDDIDNIVNDIDNVIDESAELETVNDEEETLIHSDDDDDFYTDDDDF